MFWQTYCISSKRTIGWAPSWFLMIYRGVTGIFFWGGKVIFPDFFLNVKCFFPVENFHLVEPKQILVRSKNKTKNKQTKKKKRFPLLHSSFCNFSTFPFWISTFTFTIFLLFFSTFTPYPLALYSWYVGRNFPVRSLWGGTMPLTCYTTDDMHNSLSLQMFTTSVSPKKLKGIKGRTYPSHNFAGPHGGELLYLWISSFLDSASRSYHTHLHVTMRYEW